MEYVCTNEVAKKCGVTQSTVSRWYRERKIPGAEQDANGSPWRIPIDVVTEMVRNN